VDFGFVVDFRFAADFRFAVDFFEVAVSVAAVGTAHERALRLPPTGVDASRGADPTRLGGR